MNTAKNIKLGTFIILGLIFFLVSLYFIGTKQNLFSDTLTIRARFTNISGLQQGNNVRFMGIDVGTVKEITILNDTLVEVAMVIKENASEFIKKDAKATVATDGLMGNRIINISGGSPSARQVTEGDVIKTEKQVSLDEILKTVDYTSQYTAVLSSELVTMVRSINMGKGSLGTILMDTVMSHDLRKTIANLHQTSLETIRTTAYLKKVLNDINHGDGTISAAIHDTAMRRNVSRTLADLELAAFSIKQSSHNLQLITQKIDSGGGTMATLLNDTAFAANLKETISSARQSAEGLNQNMNALKSSFLLRGYFKKQKKAAEKMQ